MKFKSNTCVVCIAFTHILLLEIKSTHPIVLAFSNECTLMKCSILQIKNFYIKYDFCYIIKLCVKFDEEFILGILKKGKNEAKKYINNKDTAILKASTCTILTSTGSPAPEGREETCLPRYP